MIAATRGAQLVEAATRRFDLIDRAEKLEAGNPLSAVARGYRLEADELVTEMQRIMPGCDAVTRGSLLAGRGVDLQLRALGATARALVDLVTLGDFFAAALMANVPLLEVATVINTESAAEHAYSYLVSVASTTAIVADGSTLTAAAPVFGGTVTSVTYKYPFFEQISNELLRDSYVEFDRLWGTRFAEQAHASLDVDLWAGNGTTAPEGLTAGVTSGVTAASATVLAVDDVANALSDLPDQYVNANTAILVSPSAFWDLRRQTLGTSAAGGQAWDVSAGSGELFGFRIRRESQLAATATGAVSAVVGDFTNGYMVRLAPARLEMSHHGIGWDKDQSNLRLVLRADGRRLNCVNALRKITMA